MPKFKKPVSAKQPVHLPPQPHVPVTRQVDVTDFDPYIFTGSILKYEYIMRSVYAMQPDQMLIIDFDVRKEADNMLAGIRSPLYKDFIPEGYRLATRMATTVSEADGLATTRVYIALVERENRNDDLYDTSPGHTDGG